MDLLTSLGNDCVGIAACSPADCPTKTMPDGTIQNEWGMQFKAVGLYNEFHRYPLANVQSKETVLQYPFPDPFAPGRYDAAQEAVARYGGDHAIVADLECSIFETAWYLVGLEKFLVDLVKEEPYVPCLLDRIAGINTQIGRELIKLGADIIWAGDDYGTQQGMIMAPDLWRAVFKPRIERMFREFRQVNPNIKIAWHSCGSIVPIIPDFIEIGLDILNPIQPLAKDMDPDYLKKRFGEELCFFGGIDIQKLLPYGSRDDIKKEVRRLHAILGDGGGFIIAPAHNIQNDTPIENVLALYEAAKEISS
jgi:uroporphyrinogen decarboxylase